jgi:hypothetical protein
MAIGIGEVSGVHPEWAHVSGRGHDTAGRFSLCEQLVDLCPRCGGDAQAELGGAGRPGRQAGVLGQIGALVQAEQQACVEGEEGDRPVGAGDLVVKLLSCPVMPSVGQPRPSR